MPYIFGILVVINAALLGYFVFLHEPTDPKTTESFVSAKAELTNPIEFENTSIKAPPPIGKK